MMGRRAEADAAIGAFELVAESFPEGSSDANLPILLAAENAVHAGEGERALRELLPELSEALDDGTLGSTEGQVSHALALLQSGRPDEALEWLAAAVRQAANAGPRANALSALALASAGAGRVDEARAAAGEVLGMSVGTYLDRVTALLAVACAAACVGDVDAAVAALDRADSLVAGTDDRLTAAIVVLARARVLEALGDPTAESVLDTARAALLDVSAPADGWDTAFRLASGMASSAPA